MQNASPQPSQSQKPEASPERLRQGRALIGWMAPEQAKLLLAHNKIDGRSDPKNAEQIMKARAEVARRPSRVVQTDVVASVPATLVPHIADFSAAAPEVAAAGWQVQIVDLRRLRAFQPVVFTEDAEARVRDVDPTDPVAIARVTVPVPSAVPVPLQFDQIQRAWTITSRNPNLRIVGHFSGPTPQGPTAVGFLVRELPSYLQVAVYQGRHLLHDGYHRAVGLLGRGATHAPALVREFGSFEDMGIGPGMLPQDAYLGERAPTLADYFDDRVAASVAIPYTHRMIVVGGFELSPNE